MTEGVPSDLPAKQMAGIGGVPEVPAEANAGIRALESGGAKRENPVGMREAVSFHGERAIAP